MAEESKVPPKKESALGWYLSLLGAIGSIIFLANPGAGILPFEIPDVIPGIGNIDEAVVTGFLISCLARLGVNVIPGLNRNRNRDTVIDSTAKKPEPEKNS